jgi:putative DNA primase/helicase
MSTKRNRPAEAAMDPHRLARNFRKRHGRDNQGRPTLRYWRAEFWRWEDGRYVPVSRTELTAEVTAAIKKEVDSANLVDGFGRAYRVTKGLVNNVLQALMGETLVGEQSEQPVWLGSKTLDGEYIALQNGLLNVASLGSSQPSLRSLTPEWFSPTALPVSYDAGADCPRWRTFLEQVLEGDAERIQLLQEFVGLCLVPDTSFQKFLVLEGSGANGKSVALEVLGALLGAENVSHVPLEAFGERFQLTPTLGKLANIAPEADEAARLNLGTLKQFTGGDRMYFDRKGVPGVQAKPTARLVIATNNRPPLGDPSDGMWRRILLIPFSVTIPAEEQDRELPRKLRGELPGILNWGLEGLVRLRSRGRFTNSTVGDQALAAYRLESNPAAVFLSEQCWADPERRVPVHDLYEAYVAWSRTSGDRPLDIQQFGKAVKRKFPAVGKQRPAVQGERTYYYVGLGFAYKTLSSDSTEEIRGLIAAIA